MTELSRFWNGTVTGDAAEAPYDAPTEFAKVLMSLSGTFAIANNGGIYEGELNELEVTEDVGSGVSINTGRGMVWGNWYQNDASVDVAIPTPAVSTRIDRIVLRKSWAAQTIRITRVAGTEGGAAPTLTQVEGLTWDFPLAQVSMTTGAVITITDEREFITGGGGNASPFQDPLFLVLM